MANELIIPEKINPVVLFSDRKNIDDLIAGITQRAALENIDLDTDKGRKEIASMAYAVSRSKTFLDDARKNVIADWKAKVDAVNANGKILRDSLDNLRDATRKPLTDWENAEKELVAEADRFFTEIQKYKESHDESGQQLSAENLKLKLAALETIVIDETLFSNNLEEVNSAKEESILRLKFHIINQEKREAEALELEKLRIEKAARDKQDKLNAIAEADRRAKSEADRKEQERLEQERRIKAAADAALRAKELAAKNIEHQRSINAAALEDFINNGIDEAISKKIIGLIAGGKIRNVSINY